MSDFGHTDAALDEGRVETTDVDEAIGLSNEPSTKVLRRP